MSKEIQKIKGFSILFLYLDKLRAKGSFRLVTSGSSCQSHLVQLKRSQRALIRSLRRSLTALLTDLIIPRWLHCLPLCSVLCMYIPRNLRPSHYGTREYVRLRGRAIRFETIRIPWGTLQKTTPPRLQGRL